MNAQIAPSALLVAIAQQAALAQAYEDAGQSDHAQVEATATAALVDEAEERGLDVTHADAFSNAVCGDLTRTIAALA